MTNPNLENTQSKIEWSYRRMYGSIYSSLCAQFGIEHSHFIEDAIQSAFLKAMKSWKPDRVPENIKNWFYIVSKRNLINQLKGEKRFNQSKSEENESSINPNKLDQRLVFLLWIGDNEVLSNESKLLFSLKQLFGLSVTEISQLTFKSTEAIYKDLQRSLKKLRSSNYPVSELNIHQADTIHLVNEILYSVFSLGYDVLGNTEKLIDLDLCLEAFSWTLQLNKQTNSDSTKNLLSLICLHLARAEAKFVQGVFVPFFEQESGEWNKDLIQRAMQLLTAPQKLDRYYLEAIITSSYMLKGNRDLSFWNEIVSCYQALEQLNDSAIIKINHAYCLYQADQIKLARLKLSEAEILLSPDHFYLQMVKAEMYKSSEPEKSQAILKNSLTQVNHEVRRAFIQKKIQALTLMYSIVYLLL